MRKLIVSNLISLDGVVDGPGDIPLPADQHFDPTSFDAYNLELLNGAGTLLLGRTTYEMFRDFWPSVAGNMDFSEDNRQLAARNAVIEKLVISDSLQPEDTAPWYDTTRIIRRNAGRAELDALKQQDGAPILVFGSHTMWIDLLEAGLVDELHLMVNPAILGEGARAFEPNPRVTLRLTGTRTWEGSPNVVLQYEVAKGA